MYAVFVRYWKIFKSAFFSKFSVKNLYSSASSLILLKKKRLVKNICISLHTVVLDATWMDVHCKPLWPGRRPVIHPTRWQTRTCIRSPERRVNCFIRFIKKYWKFQSNAFRNPTIFNIIWWVDGTVVWSFHRLMVQKFFW